MIENKRIVTSPENEEACVNHFQNLGWKPTGRQEVMNSKTVFDGASYFQGSNGIGGGTVYTHTETTHFVSFLFQRDTDDPHYEDFSKLEKRYIEQEDKIKSIQDQLNKRLDAEYAKAAKQNNTTGTICLLVGIILVIVGLSLTISKADTGWIVMFVIGCILFIVGIISFAASKKYANRTATLADSLIPKPTADELKVVDECDKQLEAIDKEAAEFCKTLPKTESKPQKQEKQESEDIKAKLAKLQDLLNSGLITKDEYETKRKELLEKF